MTEETRESDELVGMVDGGGRGRRTVRVVTRDSRRIAVELSEEQVTEIRTWLDEAQIITVTDGSTRLTPPAGALPEAVAELLLGVTR
jgi:hypothetical protein